MDRWEEEFDDLFPEVEGTPSEKMAKAYFKAGWMQAITLLQDKLADGGFDYE